MQRYRFSIATFVLIAACALQTGCKPEESKSTSAGDSAQNSASAKAKTELTEDQRVTALANLAKADVHDGKTDLVVHECLMCALRMDGKGDYTSKYEGSELHFCSAGCKKHFDEDPAGVLLAAQIETE